VEGDDGGGDIPGGESSAPTEFAAVNGTLHFVADDGVNGSKVWRSDGATIEMVPAGPGLPTGEYYFQPRALTSVNSSLFFLAEGARGLGVWTIDSTRQARETFCNGNTSCHGSLSQLTGVNETLYFVLSYDPGHILCKLDNDGAMCFKVITPPPQSWSTPAPSELTNAAGTLFFAADDGVSGRELWCSDGTNTARRWSSTSHPKCLLRPDRTHGANGTLFFAADDGLHGNELFVARNRSLSSIGATAVAPIK